MSRKKTKVSYGPDIKDGVIYKVIPANRSALNRVKASLGDKERLMESVIMLSPEQFKSKEEGVKYLIDNAEKWSGKFCPFVVIRDIDNISTTKATILLEKIKAEERALAETVDKTDVSNFKARLITCETCESKINRTYIKGSICPVCGNDMRSKTAIKTIENKRARIQRYKDKLYDEWKKHAAEAPLRYLVAVPKTGDNE